MEVVNLTVRPNNTVDTYIDTGTGKGSCIHFDDEKSKFPYKDTGNIK